MGVIKEMKIDDYKVLLSELNETENMADVLQKILDAITEDTSKLENLETTNNELNEKVRELQDTNMKLFLAQTNKNKEDDPEEEEELDADGIAKLMFE